MVMGGCLLMKLKYIKMKYFITFIVSCISWNLSQAQEHEQHYFPPSDPLVQAKIETWQDFKFGLLM